MVNYRTKGVTSRLATRVPATPRTLVSWCCRMVSLLVCLMIQIAFPGIRVTWRLASDPLNVMRDEVAMVVGSGSQTHTSGRWGECDQHS